MTVMAPETKPNTRRTEGVRVKGRAARVVSDVLIATAEELSRVGYAALRVEDVARALGRQQDHDLSTLAHQARFGGRSAARGLGIAGGGQTPVHSEMTS